MIYGSAILIQFRQPENLLGDEVREALAVFHLLARNVVPVDDEVQLEGLFGSKRRQ